MIFYAPATHNSIHQNTTQKSRAIAAELDRRGIAWVEPAPATRADVLLAHTPEYIDAVFTGEPPELARSAFGAWNADLSTSVMASTGGVIAAAQHAFVERTNAGSLSSGLHHAAAHRGRGFCTFNGLAIAAAKVIVMGARRVLILDLDAHCGGGTAAIIADMPGVEQVDVSVVTFDVYDSRPDAALHWADGSDYLEVIEQVLASIDDPAGIDLVIYNAGMDPHERAGGVDGIDRSVLERREHMVFQWAAAHSVPVAWVLAGGYTWGMTEDELVDLHLLTVEAAGHTPQPSAR